MDRPYKEHRLPSIQSRAALPVEDQFFYNLKMSAVMSKLAMLKVIAAEAECAPQ
jgi:hypothetical protein